MFDNILIKDSPDLTKENDTLRFMQKTKLQGSQKYYILVESKFFELTLPRNRARKNPFGGLDKNVPY